MKFELLGSDKIFEITLSFQTRYHILIAMFRDITNEEKAKKAKAERIEKTAEITTSIISKNMRAVQEIAQLLGESAAETKIALVNLEKSLQEDEDDE